MYVYTHRCVWECVGLIDKHKTIHTMNCIKRAWCKKLQSKKTTLIQEDTLSHRNEKEADAQSDH